MAYYDEVIERNKRYLTNAQVNALVAASQEYNIQNAGNRAGALASAREQYDTGYRGLQNMGLAGAMSGAPTSGEVPRLQTQIQAPFDAYNNRLRQVENQRLNAMGGMMAEQTRQAQAAAAAQRAAAQQAAAQQAAIDQVRAAEDAIANRINAAKQQVAADAATKAQIDGMKRTAQAKQPIVDAANKYQLDGLKKTAQTQQQLAQDQMAVRAAAEVLGVKAVNQNAAAANAAQERGAAMTAKLKGNTDTSTMNVYRDMTNQEKAEQTRLERAVKEDTGRGAIEARKALTAFNKGLNDGFEKGEAEKQLTDAQKKVDAMDEARDTGAWDVPDDVYRQAVAQRDAAQLKAEDPLMYSFLVVANSNADAETKRLVGEKFINQKFDDDAEDAALKYKSAKETVSRMEAEQNAGKDGPSLRDVNDAIEVYYSAVKAYEDTAGNGAPSAASREPIDKANKMLNDLGFKSIHAAERYRDSITNTEEPEGLQQARDTLAAAELRYKDPDAYRAIRLLQYKDQLKQTNPEVVQWAEEKAADYQLQAMGIKTPGMATHDYRAEEADAKGLRKAYNNWKMSQGDAAEWYYEKELKDKYGVTPDEAEKRLNQFDTEKDNRLEYSYYKDGMVAMLDHSGEKPTKPVNTEETDTIYRRVNGLSNLIMAASEYEGAEFDTAAKYMTQEQKDAYNAIYERDGVEAADQYFKDITPFLNMQRAMEDEAYYKQYADEHPFLADLRSVGASVLWNMPAAIDRLAHGAVSLFTDTYYDPNSSMSYRSGRADVIRSERSQNIMSNMSRPEWVNNVLNFAYQTGMSMADSGVAMTFAYAGAPWMVDALFFSSAGNAAYKEARERGATQTQAMEIGILSGAAEAIFEHASIEHFMKLDYKGKGALVKNLLSQATAEGSEEVSTEIANALTDAWIMRDKSKYAEAVNAYVAQGMTEEQAQNKAFMDQLADIGMAGIGGAVSGGLFALGGAAVSSIRYNQEGKRLSQNAQAKDRIIQLAEIMGGNAQEALDAYNADQTNRNLGELSATVQQNLQDVFGNGEQVPAVSKVDAMKMSPGVGNQMDLDAAVRDQIVDKATAYAALLSGDKMVAATAQTILDVLGAEQLKSMGYDASSAMKLMSSYNKRLDQYGIQSRADALANNTFQPVRGSYQSELRQSPSSMGAVRAGSALTQAQQRTTEANVVRAENSAVNRVWENPTQGMAQTVNGRTITPMPGNLTAVSIAEQQRNNFKANATATTGRVTYAVAGMQAREGMTNEQTLDEIKKGLTKEARAKADFYEKLSKALGLKMTIHDVMVGTNGFIDENGMMHVVLSGKQSVLRVAAHELTHFMKENAAGHYAEMRNFLIAEVGEDRFDRMVKQKAREYGIDLSTEKGKTIADDEVCAELCERMLSDTDAIERFAEKNTAAAKTLKEHLLKILNAIKAALKDAKNRDFGESRSDMVKDQETIEKWITGLDAAIENAEKNAQVRQTTREQTVSKAEADEYSEKTGQRFSLDTEALRENNEKVTKDVVKTIQSIGEKSVNQFTAEDIKATEPLARRYYREMGTKSPFFRAWFGEWRAQDVSPVSKVKGKEGKRGQYHNADTSWDINLSGKLQRETLSHKSAAGRTGRLFLKNASEIIEKSVLLGSSTTGEKSPTSIMMHYLYAVADIDGKQTVLKLSVEELRDVISDDVEKRAYILSGYEALGASDLTAKGNIPAPIVEAPINNVASLYDFVKKHDRNFDPGHAVDRSMLNEDGTPKVFYHGTSETFDAFDRTKGRANMDIQGMFFSPYEIEAGSYGENVGQYYLSISNPASEGQAYKALNMFKGQNNAGVKAREYLEKLGYDGVVGYDEVIAFEPTQIKSATDNIGTFNKYDERYRHSLDTDAAREAFTKIDTEALDKGLESLKNVTPGKGLWAIKDISRFLDSVSGGDKELRDTLTGIFETPHRQALKNYATGVNEMQQKVLDIGAKAGVCDEKGGHFDSKKSAAIQNIGEGFSNRHTDVTVRIVDADAVQVKATDKETGKDLGTKDYTYRELRGAYGREVADQLWSDAFDAAQDAGKPVDVEREVNTQPYTLDDLKAAYPQDWQKLKAAADEFRTMYDDYIRNINGMLETIYPYASKYADVDKITEAIEKKQQRLADKKAAYNVQIENLQKSLEEKEREMASKKRTDTKAYRQLVDQANQIMTKITDTQAEIAEYEANVKDELAVMGEEKALMQNAEREGDSLGRMHRLEYRSDYFHHFTEMASGVQNLKSIFTGNTDISPAVVGKSDQTKPKSRFAGFFQQRKGGDYTADALNGMLRYGQLAEYKLAFDPFAAYLRNVEKQVANLDKNETNRDNLIRYIQQWTNTILGKSHTIDRALVDSGIGMRSKMFKAMNWINSRVIQNTLLWNMRSALIQISNVTNAKGIVTNNLDWANGLRKWALAARGNTEMQSIMNQSTFLASRYMDNLQLTDSVFKSAKKFAGWLLGALDEVSAKATWWAAYEQYQRNPNAKVIQNAYRSYDNAIDYADDVTRRTHAGRGVGELAPAMTSRVINLVAPFQVEVNNTYQLLKDNVKQKNYLGLLSTGLSVFALNTIFEAIVGSTPLGFDIIRAIVDIAFGIAGDDPEDDDDDYGVGRAVQRLAGEFVGGLPYANQIVGLIGKDNAEKIIGSDTDVTRYGNTQIGLNAMMNTVAGVSDLFNAAKDGKNLFTETNFISDIDDLLNIIMPMGAKQLTRTAEGLMTMAKGYGGKADKQGNEKVQFVADNDLVNWLHAGLFGKWALTQASEYFDEERLLPKLFGAYEGPKSATGQLVDAKEYKAALETGIDGKQYFTLKYDLKGITTQGGKRAELMQQDFTPEQKAQLDALLVPSKDAEMKTEGAVVYQKSGDDWKVKADYTNQDMFDLSQAGDKVYTGTLEAIDKTGLPQDQAALAASMWDQAKEADDSKTEFRNLLRDNQNLTVAQKEALDLQYCGNKYPADYSDPDLYELSLDSNRSTYEKAKQAKSQGVSVKTFTGLNDKKKAYEGDGQATYMRGEIMKTNLSVKQKELLDDLLVSDKGSNPDYSSQAWFDVSMLGNGQYQEAKEGEKIGLTPETYLSVYNKWKTIDAKNENGKTVNGLKKKRAKEYLDSLTISAPVYDYIWTVVFGYKK